MRYLIILMLLTLAACAQSTARKLKTEIEALTTLSATMPVTHSEVSARITAYRELLDRQRELNLQARCRLDLEPRYECMNEQQRAKFREQYPDALADVVVTGSNIKSADMITNNQEAGVDEGALVKKSGDFLFLLEDATLHAMRIVRDGLPVLEHVNTVVLDAQPNASEDIWYDEILVLEDQLLVLGFNYRDSVAELHSYHIDQNGRLHRNAKYWLRSGDYFSSSGYASRIHMGKLVTRMSVEINTESTDFDWPEWSRRDVENPRWNLMVDTPNLSYALGALHQSLNQAATRQEHRRP
jgi:hypothetical protein